MCNTIAYYSAQTAAEKGTRLYHASGRSEPQRARSAARAARFAPVHALASASVQTKAAWPISIGAAPGRPRSTGVDRSGSIRLSAGAAASAVRASQPVSYTHLTLPTTPYV